MMEQSNSKMNLVKFYNEFTSEENLEVFYKNYKANYAEYTKMILEILEKNICKEENENRDDKTEMSKEYFRIDLIGWTDKRKEIYKEKYSEGILKRQGWSFDIAIEHENNYRLWAEEVIKLAYINCPIRIVIGYNDREIGKNKDLNKDIDIELLNEVLQSLNYLEGDKRMLIKDNDAFGIILGTGHTGSKAVSKEEMDYTLYLVERKSDVYDNPYILKQYTKVDNQFVEVNKRD